MERNISKLELLVKDRLNKLNDEKNQLMFNYEMLTIITEYLENKDVKVIFKLLEKNYDLDDTLKKTIEMIKYFFSNGKTEMSQYLDILETINNCDLFTTASMHYEIIKTQIGQINEDITKSNQLLLGETNDMSFILNILNGSDLSEQDILKILSYIAFSSCPKEEKILVESEPIVEKSEIFEKVISPEVLDVKNKLILDNKELVLGIEEILTRNNELMKKYLDNPRFSSYLFEVEELFEAGVVGISDLDYPEIKFVFLLNHLDFTKNSIEELLKDAKTLEELEIIKSDLMDLKRDYEIIKKLEEKRKLESLPVLNTNIIYLTDDNGELLFDLNGISPDRKAIASKIISKLDKGIFDYQKGVKPSHVHGIDDNIVRLNSLDQMRCSFIQLPNEIILILAIAGANDIIDLSKSIANKYKLKIEQIKNLALVNPEELLTSQTETQQFVNEGLGQSSGRKS